MKIIVTGACGHIGSRLVRSLSETFQETEIVMIDNMLGQRYVSLFDLPDSARYRFVEDDVMEHDLETLFQGGDVVVHLAAITNAAGSFSIKEKVEHDNYLATERVAKACLTTGVPLIHLSSTSVYGTQKEVVDENCSEEELQPQSPYAETKLREEKLLQRLHAEEGLPCVVGRFGTIFGISLGIRFHTAVNKFCWQAVLGQPLTVWSSAYEQKRPYLDLADAVRAIVFIMQERLYNGEIYNVLTHNLTVREVITEIQGHVPDLKVDFVDHEIMNQLSYNVSQEKFKALGFQYQGSISAGIRDTVNLLKNANHR